MTKTWRRPLSAAVLLLCVPALTACGFDLPTDQVYTPGVGTNDRSSSMNVLHAAIVSAEPGEGVFVAGLVNKDDQEGDALTALAGSGENSDLSVTSTGEVDVGSESLVQLADEGGVLVSGEDIEPGQFVEVTLSFARGEPVTMDVPVVSRSGAFADVEMPDGGAGGGSAPETDTETRSVIGSDTGGPVGVAEGDTHP